MTFCETIWLPSATCRSIVRGWRPSAARLGKTDVLWNAFSTIARSVPVNPYAPITSATSISSQEKRSYGLPRL
ncbi:MAG: hypothetical protein E6F97_04180 [Actinobacteria bacterium]|nr:MAG: hypothetical protein E6F97_04180 [Actinomycetota bacterium]